MRYFSTFSGIGGFELGIQQAYELQQMGAEPENSSNNQSRTSQHGERPLCVGYSEIDKYASQIYQQHFPEHKNYGDITTINTAELPDFDLLVGGFPCQAFSIAGKRRGFEDTRGTMFFELARILRDKQPRLFVFENVKGLLSHDNGQTFKTIIQTLDELGYDIQWQVLNSKNHGVPQNRERVFIVGNLRGTSRPKVFPIGADNKEATFSGVHTGTLTSRYPASQREGTYIEENGNGAGEIKQLNSPVHSNDRIYSADGLAPTLNTMQGGNRQPFISSSSKIRRLTPTECERLQGFPDDWTKYGVDYTKGLHIWRTNTHELVTISDTQRYKTLGNAVTVNVIEAIMARLLKPTN